MKKIQKIKLGDVVRFVDLQHPNYDLNELTVIKVIPAEDVYGSTSLDLYEGVSSSTGKEAGGTTTVFNSDQVVVLNKDFKDARDYVVYLLESNIDQHYTKLTMQEQLLILGVLKAYAS